MSDVRAASVQFQHAPGDKEANFSTMQPFVESAAEQDVDILSFPEMCISGYWHVRNLSRDEVAGLAEPRSGPSVERLQNWARGYEMTLGAGFLEEASDGQFYNTYAVALPDGRVQFHRKLHCFLNQHMSSGDEFTVFEGMGDYTLGVLTCYDNNIIENVRVTALRGAEILLAPHQTGGCDSASPRAMGTIDPQLWHDRDENPEAIEAEFRGPKGRAWLMRWLPARAHDNGLYLIFSNGVGLDDNEVRTGNAMIIDPYGEIMVETWQAANEMVVADLDLDVVEMSSGRRWFRSRRPELYRELTDRTGKEQDTRTVRFESSG